jgi:hypothetical protein
MVAFHSPPEPSPAPPPESLTFATHEAYEEWRRINTPPPEVHEAEPSRAAWDWLGNALAAARDRETYPDHDTSGSPYRSPAPRPEPVVIPWRVTRWQKLYVRAARLVFDVRAPYRRARELRRYERRLAWWRDWDSRVQETERKILELARHIRGPACALGRRPPKIPPMPCPPPAWISE